MSQAEVGTTGFDLFKALRARRDGLMNAWAGVALRVSSSRPYFVVSSALSRPALFVTGASRKATAAATSQILAQMNMPSREDVLALSKRLTRIEMVLDDIGAAMDAAAASGKSRVVPRQPQRVADGGNGGARAG
jgi:hypothetical protein